MDRNLALELVRVTEAAALASARFMGKGDPIAADRAAATAMELAIRGVRINANIVIDDESCAEGSALCKGRVVGGGGDIELDLALDPLESKASLADGGSNAISAITVGEHGSFYRHKYPYMEKIAVGADAAESIDLDLPVFENLVRIAEAKRVYVEDLTVSILNRERHLGLIAEVRKAGARIELCRDGDLAAAISAALPGTGIDVAMGIGDSKQGILAAAALACLRGGFQARFMAGESADAEADDPELAKIFGIRDLTGSGNIMFAVTGVSHSDFLDGVLFRPGGAITHSLVLRAKSGTIRFLRTEHFFDMEPDYK